VLGKKSPWDVTKIEVMEEAVLAEDVDAEVVRSCSILQWDLWDPSNSRMLDPVFGLIADLYR